MGLADSSTVIALDQADLQYWPQWLEDEVAHRWLDALLSETP